MLYAQAWLKQSNLPNKKVTMQNNRRTFLRSLLAGAALIATSSKFAAAEMLNVESAFPVGVLGTNQWRHVAYTREGSEVKMYLDGVRVSDVYGINVTSNQQEKFMEVTYGDKSLVKLDANTADKILSDNSAFTLEFWVKPTSSAVYQSMASASSSARSY